MFWHRINRGDCDVSVKKNDRFLCEIITFVCNGLFLLFLFSFSNISTEHSLIKNASIVLVCVIFADKQIEIVFAYGT